MLKAVFYYPTSSVTTVVEFPALPHGLQRRGARPHKLVIEGQVITEDPDMVKHWFARLTASLDSENREIITPPGFLD
jgi:hypothetical protein